MPWGMAFPNALSPTKPGVFVHPTPLYEIVRSWPGTEPWHKLGCYTVKALCLEPKCLAPKWIERKCLAQKCREL